MYRELKLTSQIPPSVNHYLGYRAIMRGGKPMAASYVTKEAKEFKGKFIPYVKEEAQKQNWAMDSTGNRHVFVDCVFYFDRTDMDCNNYFKLLLDAITESGVVWPDDNIVCERVQRIMYDRENPRIEIEIHYVEYFGIFDDASQMEEFETRCVGCSRYKRNCSNLRKAKEGRIQSGVTNTTCDYYKRSKGGTNYEGSL